MFKPKPWDLKSLASLCSCQLFTVPAGNRLPVVPVPHFGPNTSIQKIVLPSVKWCVQIHTPSIAESVMILDPSGVILTLKILKTADPTALLPKKKAEITSYWRCRRFSKMLDAYDKSIGKQKQTFNISKFQPRNLPSCRHDTKSHHHQRTRQGLQML